MEIIEDPVNEKPQVASRIIETINLDRSSSNEREQINKRGSRDRDRGRLVDPKVRSRRKKEKRSRHGSRSRSRNREREREKRRRKSSSSTDENDDRKKTDKKDRKKLHKR